MDEEKVSLGKFWLKGKGSEGVGIEKRVWEKSRQDVGTSRWQIRGDRWIATVRRSCPVSVLAIWAARKRNNKESGSRGTGQEKRGFRAGLTEGEQANRLSPESPRTGSLNTTADSSEGQSAPLSPLLTNWITKLNATWLVHVLPYSVPYD